MFKISKTTAAAIRWLVKNLGRLSALIKQVDSIRGSGAARVRVTPDGIVVHVDPVTIQQASGGIIGHLMRVDSSTVATADAQWNYELMPQRDGASSWDGLQDHGTETYPARNTYESARLTNAGFVNGSVSGLHKIPDDAIVLAFWRNVNGELRLVFSERNEPICG